MADQDKTEDSEETPKSSKKLLISIIAAVVVLLGGGAAGFFFLMGSDDEVVEEVRLPAVYTHIRTKNGRPMFVSTVLSDDERTHYLQAYVVAKSRDPLVAPALEKHMPLIVSRLNTMFSTQEFAKLSTLEGKQNLRSDATKLLQDIMRQRIDIPGVEEVLFTNFVMQ
ncbi:MAG: flagellar basal body-associated FliL family protein [Pseudomonadales bacterium]|nr:flagellar basal body-associated FliL family protein [Pseudomonadales bacterium]NRA18041.1 flagellar basal body-associated FliL family protein [Oceanospirillaceae bacterium]